MPSHEELVCYIPRVRYPYIGEGGQLERVRAISGEVREVTGRPDCIGACSHYKESSVRNYFKE